MTTAARTRACIGIGANLGDARAALDQAREAIAGLPHTTLVASSPVYRSAPIDAAGPDYLNAVAVVDTALAPEALLGQLQRIEHRQGRVRSQRNAPRTLDLDLLLYGDQQIAGAALVVPHPRMHERAFVLKPLLDVLPDAHIPGIGPAADCLPALAGQRIEKLVP
ncbi:MAG TPA: 2-amino-4-hydroxy-6-hydroxymethyldihydropteridine diphosphokinase [Albitalea sp.]|uniref:2-amino-4-hydroxy-6- hydroxymethyldihydropteridine diphosphokinase n=1 Tax=Piscinibacter sp. TaxID=1903157 RepID=UPI002ED1BD22